MSNHQIDHLAPYKFHGVHLRVKGKEGVGDCPFCGKENHFHVSTATGQYRCLVECCEPGNTFSFLQRIYDDAVKRTKKSDWERLSSLRDNLPWQVFRDHGLAWQKSTGRWLLPVLNPKGALSNLCVFAPPKIPALIGTSNCVQHLYLADKIQPTGPIYVCEGQWDAIALRSLLKRCNIDDSLYSVVAVPGAGSFKKEWVELFKNREAFLMFDHDTAGSNGMDKIVAMLSEPKLKCKVRRIQWPSELPDGYDVRDFVTHKGAKAKQAWQNLLALFPEKDAKDLKGKPKLVRSNFQSVLKDFRKTIHTDKAWEEALAVCAAVVISGKLRNDPLWMFLVGPPGAGKTLLVESFLNCRSRTMYLSKITRPALVSGFRGEDDYSILDKLRELCLIVKDYTAITSLPIGVQEELYGILRDAYDGHVTVPFGNMEPKEYSDLYFSMIASVTDVIRTHNRAALGERFLKMELLDELTHDPTVHIRTALSAIEDNIAEKANAEEFLRDSVAAFMDRPFDETKLPKIPNWLTERLINLAQLGANLRAVVATEGGELSYRPRPEVGTRLAKQLAKLARCLCWVYDKKKIDDQVYNLVQRVALDTVLGWDLEILHALYAVGEKGATVPDIGAVMQLSHTGISRRLDHLKHLSIVYRTSVVKRDERGRPQYVWHMAPAIHKLWKGSNMQYAPPPIVKFKPRNGYTPKRKAPPTKARTKRVVARTKRITRRIRRAG